MEDYFGNGLMDFCKEYIRKHNKLFVCLLVFSFVLGVISLTNTYMIGMLIDMIQDNGTFQCVIWFLVVYVLIQLTKMGVTYVMQYLIAKYNLLFANEVNENVLKHLHKVKILEIKKYDSVYLSERINSDSNVLANFMLSSIESAFMQGVLLLVLLLIMIMIGWKYAILLVCVCLTYAIAFLAFRKQLYMKMKAYREETSNYLRGVNEQITFGNFIQINNLQESFVQRLKHSFASLLKQGMSLQITSNSYGLLQSMIFLFISSVIILCAGKGLIDHEITVGQLGMILTYTSTALGTISGLIGFGQVYQNSKTSYDRLTELSRLEQVQNGELECEAVNCISLENASFSFDYNVGLQNLTFEFKKGKKYLLLGENGSGKSTLIYLILDQYQYLTGTIKIDGVDLRQYNMAQIRKKHFAVMEQELDFPQNSILDYINMCNQTSYTEKQMMKILYAKGLDHLACDLLDLVDRGVTNINFTSGGEKQKIEIARVILKDTDVMIFDEPTAHLDFESRDEFYQYIDSVKEDKIVIVVSHMKEEREHFDEIIYMNQYTLGKVDAE